MSTLISRSLTATGSILLAHACYSAYEHSKLNHVSPGTSYPSPAQSKLPLDISVETVISVFLVCIGLVLGAEALQPIRWRVWAGEMERESPGGPFRGLEERVGFMDIRVRRKEFADWIRDKGSLEKR